MIPLQLKNCKFCRVQKESKKPIEKEWTKRPYTYQEIIEFVPKENYGVLCGFENLIVIDCDDRILAGTIQNKFPETFTVKTGGDGYHFYFFVEQGLEKKIILYDFKNNYHLGEIQTWGQQVVGPNSIHPNKKKYEVIIDKEIQNIPLSKIYEELSEYFEQVKEDIKNADIEKSGYTNLDDLSVLDIFGSTNLKKTSKGEYYGPHPIHGSTGGMNFWINPYKNVWTCFRCGSGGGVLSAIAVKEGIINCSEARRGSLRGDNAVEAIKLAKSRYGYVEKKSLLDVVKSIKLKHPEEINKEVQDYEIIWDKELENYQIKEKEWIVDKLIPNKSVCILTGKRGTMKTFLALLLCYSVAKGTKFLNNFDTKQGKIIYLDKENGINIMKKRTKMIKDGLESNDNNDFPIGFICFSQIKIDKLGGITAIEQILEEHKPKLLIIDTYRRAVGFDENDAGKVSELFVDILRPIVEKNDVSIILIHHNRKSSGGSGESVDEMDELRGSSDLANYADIIIKLERKSQKLIIKQLKNRNAEEFPAFSILTNFCVDDNGEVNHLKFIYEGEQKKETQIEKCIENLMIWFTQDNIKRFRTHNAKEIAFRKGIKETNFKNALVEMTDRGIIKKTYHGLYEVINLDEEQDDNEGFFD